MVPKDHKIHCHCFTGYYYNAKRWLEAFPNLYIGVTPLVTYATARPSHDLARNIPLNRLLLETDAPYFIPRCVSICISCLNSLAAEVKTDKMVEYVE